MAASDSNLNHATHTRSGRLATVALAVLALLATMLLGSQAASAKTAAKGASVPAHTRAELSMMGYVGHEINVERKANHLPPVRLNQDLILSARRHNLQMAAYDEMSHQLPGEAFFADRMTAAGYRWSWAGENIAWNSDISVGGVLTLERLMYNEKAPNNGHRLNILSTHFQDVGVDVYIDKVHHKVWLTTDYGRH